MSLSPEAKQAAEKRGYDPSGNAHYFFCEGYDTATAKLTQDEDEKNYRELERWAVKKYGPEGKLT